MKFDNTAGMKKNKFQTGKVALVSFSHFVHDVYTSFLAPLLPLIIEKLSLTLGQAGLLSTVMQIPALLNPFIGLFADSKGLARWLVILAPTITAIPMSFIGLASSYWMLLVLLFTAGVSVALYHVPAPVMVAQLSGDRKGRGMSMFMTGGELSRTLGPMIAVGLVSTLGLEGFYPVFIFAVMTSVFLYFFLEKSEKKEKLRKNGSLKASFKEIRHVMIPLSGILAARAFMHASMGIFLTVYVTDKTGSLWYGGAALTLYEAFGVAGVISSGTLSDWMGRQRVLFWALVTAPAAIFGFIMTTGIFQILMLVVTGFTVLSTTPVMLAIIQDHATENPAAANGLFMMVSFAFRALAVTVVGVIGDFAGLEMMFVISALAGVLAIPFLLKLKD
jgi:FSR family fosmidomycin resistance protein-like MFS transporter